MKYPTPHARKQALLSLRPGLMALAATGLCTLSVPAHAQTTGTTVLAQNLRAPSLSETVVAATRTEQPLSDLVADVSIVDRDSIERSGATGLGDLLARLPGVEMSRNGGPGTQTSLFLRGAESRFTAVYIDGVRMDSQATGGAAWEAIPLGLIDRIEVLRGPAGAVYGSDALGGVIQIFTKRGEKGFAPFVSVGVGNRGTTKLEAGVSGASGTVDYALGLLRDESDGFNARPIAGQNPDKDGYRNTAGNARVGVQLNAVHRLEGTLMAGDTNSGYDSGLGNDDRNLHTMHALGLNWQAQWSSAYKTKFSVTDSRDEYETKPSVYLSDTRLRGYLFQNEWRQGAHQLTAALERREDHLENNPIDRDRSQNGVALGYGYNAGGHTVQVNVRHDEDSEFGGKGTGSVAYGYAITPQWRATASVGTAFRAPTLYQRFSQYGVASLRPETARNAELGLRYAQGSSTFSAVAFRNRVSDLISFAGTGPCASTFGCYANTARAEYKGVTLAASHRVGPVQLRGSLDLQRPRDLDTGKQLARRAKHHGTFGADTVVAGWTLGAEVQASGRRYDTIANTNVLGGYTLVNLYASTRIARDYTLLARVDNVADKDYQLARTYATPGRTLFVGLKWAPQ
ncbi:TonB-dependent receptor [Acidovorax sp. 1608163]|uniref:TonB-dependent receptor domain-containing protein n=1 Tax=Acidovorax sp. 1608163 TaxID=2478662 RepID=UPI000EF6683C|nr:TonB-dependent receptor [Acidovorax sp. 1608163]AYM96041.1 TonB-dependent receptor [Acidovorax sp. 1608163]